MTRFVMNSNHPHTRRSSRMLTPAQHLKSTGFTLIELMVALAMSAFLIGGILLMQQSSRIASAESENWSRSQESVRFISEFLVREARNAGFRDQLSLPFGEFNLFGGFNKPDPDVAGKDYFFASTRADGTELIIRHAGLAHCEEPLTAVNDLTAFPDRAQIVTNRYFVANGEFRCAGTFGYEANTDGPGQALADGIQSINFEFLCPSAGCTCELWQQGDNQCDRIKALEESCYGVKTSLELEPISLGQNAPAIDVELTSTFRNVLLDRMKFKAVPGIDGTCP